MTGNWATGCLMGAGTLGAHYKVGVIAHLTGSGGLGQGGYSQLTFFTVTGDYYAVADPSVSGTQNLPQLQPINALITFTPRLPIGELVYISDYLITPAYHAEQTINIIGNATGGTFTISYGALTSQPIAWNASNTAVQAALQAMGSIGGGNVIVTPGINPQSYNVLFVGTLGAQHIPIMQGDAELLSNVQGAGFCEVTVTGTTTGSPQVMADTAVALPPLRARIYAGVLSTIDYTDTPGFQLVANTPALNLDGPLVYDVTFSDVTFNGSSQNIAPFAFAAPTGPDTVCLTDPTLPLVNYQIPSVTEWTPSGGNVAHTQGGNTLAAIYPMRKGWRERAAAPAPAAKRRRG